VAGLANCKDDLIKDDRFRRLKAMCCTHCRGERGFDEAIDLSVEALGAAQLAGEKLVLDQFLAEVEID